VICGYILWSEDLRHYVSHHLCCEVHYKRRHRGKKLDGSVSTDGGNYLPRATYRQSAQMYIKYNNLNKMLSRHILRTLVNFL
jgi:hypothetical protein